HLGGSVESSGAAATRFDAPAGEFSLESAAVYARQGMDLIGRLAGDVQGDRVGKLRRFSWAGHVFNLHTREGWYSSNNHSVSNCDCGVDTVESGSDPGQVLEPARLELIHSAIEAEFGGTDRAAKYLDGGNERSDYLDLIVVNEHSELGPILGW